MRQRATWVIVIVIAAAAWLLVRHSGRREGGAIVSPNPIAVERRDVTQDSDRTPRDEATHRSDAQKLPPASTSAVAASGDHARPPDVPAAPEGRAGTTSRSSAPATPPPAPPAGSDEGSGGKFTDRTGWGDNGVAKQLNKEFMPLASQCIEQAQARNRRLQGMLAFTMVIAPADHGKAIVASLKIRPDNQINDPELFECIRESSFSLEGLQAPHDFDITMPIRPEGSGQ